MAIIVFFTNPYNEKFAVYEKQTEFALEDIKNPLLFDPSINDVGKNVNQQVTIRVSKPLKNSEFKLQICSLVILIFSEFNVRNLIEATIVSSPNYLRANFPGSPTFFPPMLCSAALFTGIYFT